MDTIRVEEGPMKVVHVEESAAEFLEKRSDIKQNSNIQGLYVAREKTAYIFMQDIKEETQWDILAGWKVRHWVQCKLVEYHEFAHHMQYASDGYHKMGELVADRYAVMRMKRAYPRMPIPDSFDRSRQRLPQRIAARAAHKAAQQKREEVLV